jgi:hypothetical protein
MQCLLSSQGKKVEYALRAFPLGGFVAFPDDDLDCPYPKGWCVCVEGAGGGALSHGMFG